MDNFSSDSEDRPIRRWIIRIVVLLMVLFLAGVVGLFFYERSLASDQVMPGVRVAGVPFTKLTKSDAVAAVTEVEAELAKKPLPVRVNARLLDLEPTKVGFRLKPDETFARALAAGRDAGLLRDFWSWLLRFREPQNVDPVGELEREQALRVIAEWETQMVDVPFSGGVKLDGDNPRPDPPRAGHLVDRDAAVEALSAGLASSAREVVDIKLVEKDAFRAAGAVDAAAKRAEQMLSGPVTLVGEGEVSITFQKEELVRAFRSHEPSPALPEVGLSFDAQTLDALLGDLRSKVDVTPEDARFFVEGDRVRVIPARVGTVVNAQAVADAVLQAAASPGRVGPLPIHRGAQPKVTTDDLEALGVSKLLGEFTTSHACCQPRVDNIHRIADLLKGTIVKPGETFSVNEAVGPRDAKHGFKAAPTIEEGEMVDSLGGGISQFATTLFNALFLAGFDIIERAPHTYYFSRYPMGRDATLSYPKPDLSFKNDTAAGALLWTEYTDTSITVKVFGENGGRKVSFRVSPQEDVEKPPVEYIPDMTQPPDKETVKEAGQLGWTVHVTREVRYSDGTKKEDKRKVTYKPRVRRVVVHPCKVPEGEAGHTGEKCPDEDAGASDGGT